MKKGNLLLIALLTFTTFTIAGQVSIIEKNERSSINNTDSTELQKKPLILYDGIIVRSVEELNSIDPNDIQEIVVIKQSVDEYIEIYGPIAKDGIVFIHSKRNVANKWMSNLAEYNQDLRELIINDSFDYTRYKFFINRKLISEDFFNKLEDLIENQSIMKVKLRKPRNNEHLGKIMIKIKPSA